MDFLVRVRGEENIEKTKQTEENIKKNEKKKRRIQRKSDNNN